MINSNDRFLLRS